MTPKIFISVYPFGREDKAVLALLEKTGWEIKFNLLGRKLKAEETTELARDCDGLIAGTENLQPLIEQNPNLKMISRVGIGLDNVPLKVCRKKNIAVSYTPDAVTPAVVEMTLGLMISLSRKLYKADQEIRTGVWSRHYGKRIGESVIGIIGFGRVGSRVAKYLLPFQPAEILVNDIKEKSDEVYDLEKMGLKIRIATKEEIFAVSDIVSIHTPLTDKTYKMITAKELNTMRPDSFLINTARGGIIDEEDLYLAINSGRIAGVALDVFEKEPYQGKLSELKNIILTQHMGSCSYDCRRDMEFQATEEVIRFFNGEKLLRAVPDEEYRYE